MFIIFENFSFVSYSIPFSIYISVVYDVCVHELCVLVSIQDMLQKHSFFKLNGVFGRIFRFAAVVFCRWHLCACVLPHSFFLSSN